MTSRPVVIISPARDTHAIAVRDRLAASGVPVRLLDTSERMPITLHEQLEHVEIGGELVTPSTVYVRDPGVDPLVTAIVHRWEAASIPTYNPLSAFQRISKPYQLALLAAAQLPVPRTRWTNDPGAVCAQDQLTGEHVRVYVLDRQVIASVTQAMAHHALSDALRRTCRRAAEVLGLRFTGIDLQADDSGKLHILELDPSPTFLEVDDRAGSDVLGALCAALAPPLAAATTDDPPTARAHRRSSKQ